MFDSAKKGYSKNLEIDNIVAFICNYQGFGVGLCIASVSSMKLFNSVNIEDDSFKDLKYIDDHNNLLCVPRHLLKHTQVLVNVLSFTCTSMSLPSATEIEFYWTGDFRKEAITIKGINLVLVDPNIKTFHNEVGMLMPQNKKMLRYYFLQSEMDHIFVTLCDGKVCFDDCKKLSKSIPTLNFEEVWLNVEASKVPLLVDPSVADMNVGDSNSESLFCTFCKFDVEAAKMRRHIAGHIIYYQEGQRELRDICGFCGKICVQSSSKCFLGKGLQNCECIAKKTIFNKKKSASMYHGNHPVACKSCNQYIWSYCLKSHVETEHKEQLEDLVNQHSEDFPTPIEKHTDLSALHDFLAKKKVTLPGIKIVLPYLDQKSKKYRIELQNNNNT